MNLIFSILSIIPSIETGYRIFLSVVIFVEIAILVYSTVALVKIKKQKWSFFSSYGMFMMVMVILSILTLILLLIKDLTIVNFQRDHISMGRIPYVIISLIVKIAIMCLLFWEFFLSYGVFKLAGKLIENPVSQKASNEFSKESNRKEYVQDWQSEEGFAKKSVEEF